MVSHQSLIIKLLSVFPHLKISKIKETRVSNLLLDCCSNEKEKLFQEIQNNLKKKQAISVQFQTKIRCHVTTNVHENQSHAMQCNQSIYKMISIRFSLLFRVATNLSVKIGLCVQCCIDITPYYFI